VYTKRFAQVNSWSRALTNVLVSSLNLLNTTTLGNFTELLTACHAQLKMAPTETLVAQCESYIVGYNLKNKAILPMINLCRNKSLVIPCEKYDCVHFNGTNNSSGINTTVTTKFINTKAAVLLFTRAISNLTCQRNPLMNDLTIKIDGKCYPYIFVNSLSTDFIK
jgi:hypothetical protein